MSEHHIPFLQCHLPLSPISFHSVRLTTGVGHIFRSSHFAPP
ncbi:MAG: hypothetical protein ABFR63_06795 [Thermodesulfobacteriota bacterium]